MSERRQRYVVGVDLAKPDEDQTIELLIERGSQRVVGVAVFDRLSRTPPTFYELVVRGWTCRCGQFNGEEQQLRTTCRSCEALRPRTLCAKP